MEKSVRFSVDVVLFRSGWKNCETVDCDRGFAK